MALSATARPIAGAVATEGVSDRVAFLRKTYAHLGGALVAFVLVTAGMMKYMTELSLKLSFAGRGGMGALFVLLAFVAITYGAQKLAMSETSRGLQYLGLGITVVLWSILAQPLIWFTVWKFGATDVLASSGTLLSAKAAAVLGEAAIVTLAIFVGLTLTVFYTKKDFSFLGGILSMSMWALIGVVIASLIFGFHLGMIYSGIVIFLMGGYILYETTMIMKYFRPSMHVAAALMLFTTVITLFIHVLRILAEMNRR